MVSSSSSFSAWVADLTSLDDELGPGSVEINPSSPALLVVGMFHHSDREKANVDTYQVHLVRHAWNRESSACLQMELWLVSWDHSHRSESLWHGTGHTCAYTHTQRFILHLFLLVILNIISSSISQEPWIQLFYEKKTYIVSLEIP